MHKLIIQLLGQAKKIGSSSYEHQNNAVMATTSFSVFGIVPKFTTNGNLANWNSPKFG
jgi:hypothetical protein